MNKKTVTLLGLALAIAAITYITYNSISQIQDIDYDLFSTEEEQDD